VSRPLRSKLINGHGSGSNIKRGKIPSMSGANVVLVVRYLIWKISMVIPKRLEVFHYQVPVLVWVESLVWVVNLTMGVSDQQNIHAYDMYYVPCVAFYPLAVHSMYTNCMVKSH
jgi:hypothetical protein